MDLSSYAASTSGIVYLVGAGPGDPGLLTVRARALLDRCDADRARRAHASRHAGAQRPRRTAGASCTSSASAAATSGRHSRTTSTRCSCGSGREGKRVVRLKGGDPFVFGRGSEEAQALAEAGVAFEVVPGITPASRRRRTPASR